jgi:hypothetical protein
VQFALTFHDPVNGSANIQKGEVFLTDAGNTRRCDYLWQKPNILTRVQGTDPGSNENFCTVSLVSIVDDPSNLNAVTLNLNVTFTAAPSATYNVNSNVQDAQGLSSSTQQIGTVTVTQGYGSVNLTDNGNFVTSVYLAVLGRDPDQAG